MGISTAGFDPNRNIMQHPNVLIEGNEDRAKCQTNSALYSALAPLLSARPNWRFVAKEGSHLTNGTVVMSRFAITEEGEELGEITLEWKGRGYKLMVTNERIQKERHKGRSYFTEKPEKATLAIRKNFFRLAVAERIEKARVAAHSVVQSEANGKESKLNSAYNNIFSEARRFCELNLTDYLNFANKNVAYQGVKRAEEERDCTRAIKKAFDSDKTYIVVLDLTQYVVYTAAEGSKTFDDDTLPDDIRGKLGLLKLVQPKQMISNVGCRVAESVFVVMQGEAQ